MRFLKTVSLSIAACSFVIAAAPGHSLPASEPSNSAQNPYPTYIYPTQGTLTSGYGPRWGRMHRGIDIANAIGTPIRAAAEGIVTYAGWNKGGYGNLVEIRHADGSLTRYAHNQRLLVRSGEVVSQGELIAEMGSTGRSTGSHCHFEIVLPGKGAVDPAILLPPTSYRQSSR